MPTQFSVLRVFFHVFVVVSIYGFATTSARAQNNDLNFDSRVEPFVPRLSITPEIPVETRRTPAGETVTIPLSATLGRINKRIDDKEPEPKPIAQREATVKLNVTSGYKYDSNANKTDRRFHHIVWRKLRGQDSGRRL